MIVNASSYIEILLVEDNPTDILITREALLQAKVLNKIHVVEDGEAAMQFLHREGAYLDAPRPDLIVLDLNLPKKSGQEVLEELKADPGLKYIPVVILTTSKAEEDILEAYGNHANCYVVKPMNFLNFVDVVKTIRQFWFGVVTYPVVDEDDKN
jgi:CheY-like chemotaxis protein